MDIEELQSSLDDIRAWRKLELSQARSLAERHSSAAELPYLCRAWTLMIYAHCDQALKLIAKSYLGYLSDHPRSDYNYKTVWLTFFGKEAIQKGSDNRFSMCRDDTAEIRESVIKNISGKEIFDSGNFSYHQLRFFSEWVMQSKFDHQSFKGFCGTLKEKRDGIAHGEEVLIRDVSDCMAWHDPAVELLDALVDTTMDVALKH